MHSGSEDNPIPYALNASPAATAFPAPAPHPGGIQGGRPLLLLLLLLPRLLHPLR